MKINILLHCKLVCVCVCVCVCVWASMSIRGVVQSAGAVEYFVHLSRGVRPPPTHLNECPEYDTKQSDSEVPVML